MAASGKKLAASKSSADSTAAVDAFMASLKHPHKPAIETLRKIIRTADPSVAEGVKWNAPSFRTREYFATTHLRDKKGIGLVLHLGAKVRESANPEIKDPHKLLSWLAKDRAIVSFAGLKEVQSQGAALQGIVRQWIKFV